MQKALAQYRAASDAHSRREACIVIQSTFRRMILLRHNLVLPPNDEKNIPALVECDMIRCLVPVSNDVGAIVMLAQDLNTGRFVVVKQYLLEGNPWVLQAHVLRQLHASSCVLEAWNQTDDKKVQESLDHLQEPLDVQIYQGTTFLIFKYYPLTFDFVYKQQTPTQHFAIRKTIDLLRAIFALHSSGTAHRDIKDANICFDDTGRLVLIDFDAAPPSSGHMRTTIPVCTSHTRPPEHMMFAMQLAERNLVDVATTFEQLSYDARAGDWWGAGCVVAQMLLRGVCLFQPLEEWSNKDYFDHVSEVSHQMQIVVQEALEFEKAKITNAPFKAKSSSEFSDKVQTLRRCGAPLNVLVLVTGLLNMDPCKRASAAALFLNQSTQF